MNKGDKLDLRVIRTRKLIRNAFIALLEEKEFHKISIQAIAEKAEINRVTFYLHYQDINDLVDSIMNELLQDFDTVMKVKLDRGYEQGNELAALTVLLEHIADNARIYKIMLVSKPIPLFTPKLMDVIRDMILSNQEKQAIKQFDDYLGMNIPSDITAWYGMSAMVGTIAMWLGNDMPYTPKFLAQKLIQLNP